MPRDVPLDPYALGLLLGDGCLTTATTPAFATADPELAEALEAALAGHRACRTRAAYDYVLRHVGGGGEAACVVANPVTAVAA